jgi:1-acyl-sn-glycerol-3-phosphate acyltransferase
LFKIEFHGVENVPLEGACIITPNHVTYADPIWVTIPIYRRVHFMAWDKPFQIPVLGQVMRMFGAFPVNLDVAADASAHRDAIELLRNGQVLAIFPEGGRTKTGKLMPFKMGAFRLAVAHSVPIVPVSVKGAREIWPVGQIFPRPGKLTITYHRPIEVKRVAGETSKFDVKRRARELANKTRDVVANALEATSLSEADEALSGCASPSHIIGSPYLISRSFFELSPFRKSLAITARCLDCAAERAFELNNPSISFKPRSSWPACA